MADSHSKEAQDAPLLLAPSWPLSSCPSWIPLVWPPSFPRKDGAHLACRDLRPPGWRMVARRTHHPKRVLQLLGNLCLPLRGVHWVCPVFWIRLTLIPTGDKCMTSSKELCLGPSHPLAHRVSLRPSVSPAEEEPVILWPQPRTLIG